MPILNLAVFASGGGSNADIILEKSKNDFNHFLNIKLLVCNKQNAGVINVAKKHGKPCFVWNNKSIKENNGFLDFLLNNNINGIILAGFLQKIPDYLLEAFPDKIVNIHPSLLPLFGGKGMYGMHVHKAVFDAKKETSGITIHLVNAEYDKGKVLFQKSTPISDCTSAEEIAAKVLKLEHQHYYEAIKNHFALT